MCEKMNKKKKKSSWFHSVKKFFGLDPTSRSDKKERRRRWALERLQNRRKPPPLTAPSQRPSSASVTANANANANTSQLEEEEKEKEKELFQSKNALNVAMATAAAAEAAVAAAQMAAQAFQLTTKRHIPHTTPTKQINNNNNTTPPAEIESPPPKLKHALQNKIQQVESVRIKAAVTIQSAFRGYLARKALRALKGIVKLQAIIRGKNVRRHAMETMKRLQSIVHIHSQVCSTRSNMAAVERKWDFNDNFQIQQWRDKIKVEKRWDDSLLSKDREDAMVLSRKEAELKRERIRAYSFNHRRSAESENRRPNGRWRYWLEQWVDTQLNKSKEFEDLDSLPTPNPKLLLTDQYGWRQRSNLKPQQPASPLRRQQQQYEAPQLESPAIRARQLRHRRQSSMGDDKYSYPSSPSVVPTYMAATESAKAKARSLSNPKTRPGAFDAYSDSYSPYKNKLSLMSTSFVSEVASNTHSYRSTRPHQRSPRLRELHLHAHPAVKSEKEAPP